jgi:hypothetical protein
MKTYQKINTLYNRYMFLDKKVLPYIPNEKWRQFRNLIIMGEFSFPEVAALRDVKWDASEKADGTNSKLAFFPSTQSFKVEGKKSETTDSQDGQFEFISAIGERVKEQFFKMFPYPEQSSYVPELEPNKKIKYFYDVTEEQGDMINGKSVAEIAHEYEGYGFSMPQVHLIEQPIILYGEYYGGKIQGSKIGGRYGKNNFRVFDVLKHGHWMSVTEVEELCAELGIDTVPNLGQKTIREAEMEVIAGFKSKISEDPDFDAEGMVLRAPCGLCDRWGNRIIVKIKTKDYQQYDRVRSQFTDEEFREFDDWYHNDPEVAALRAANL